MITYVNTVLVTNKKYEAFATSTDLASNASKSEAVKKAGAVVLYDVDNNAYDITANTKRFKIGVITDNATQNKKNLEYIPVVKWSNVINVKDIKDVNTLHYKDDKEEKVVIDFTKLYGTTKNLFAQGGCTITLRITYKDMPTRFRKWTESYTYVTNPGDTTEDIINALARNIMVTPARQRVEVAKTATTITLTGMKYDDDEQAVTENVYGKVRFDVNMYYSNSKAPGWASNNKYELAGVVINKEEGETYAASAKLVRDRERSAFDYSGVLHRCCWYDPQPKMIANIDNKYSALTLEFENVYRTADDLWRRTKQSVELYMSNNGENNDAQIDAIAAKINTAISGKSVDGHAAVDNAEPVVDE